MIPSWISQICHSIKLPTHPRDTVNRIPSGDFVASFFFLSIVRSFSHFRKRCSAYEKPESTIFIIYYSIFFAYSFARRWHHAHSHIKFEMRVVWYYFYFRWYDVQFYSHKKKYAIIKWSIRMISSTVWSTLLTRSFQYIMNGLNERISNEWKYTSFMHFYIIFIIWCVRRKPKWVSNTNIFLLLNFLFTDFMRFIIIYTYSHNLHFAYRGTAISLSISNCVCFFFTSCPHFHFSHGELEWKKLTRAQRQRGSPVEYLLYLCMHLFIFCCYSVLFWQYDL